MLIYVSPLNFYGVTDVKVITGFEDSSGKQQLKTLFDFFCRAEHKNKVVFVWDCDAEYTLIEKNYTYPYVLENNSSNLIATRGIENMFPESLFIDFMHVATDSKGVTTKKFDESRKKDFTNFILNRNEKSDFVNFEPLIKKIDEIKPLV